MSDRLKLAFDEAAKLPENQQDAFAAFLLAELEDEAEWQRQFDSSPGTLKTLADEARREHLAGRTVPLEDVIG